jgi:triacylglycerol lipase
MRLSTTLACLVVAASSNAPFDVSDANRTLHLAYTAFCNESAVAAWNCQWCTGPNTYAEPVELVKYLKDTKAGTQGYVGIDRARSRVVVAYRGSKNLANDIEDAKFLMRKCPFGPVGMRVDTGFLEAYQSVRNATTAAVSAALDTCDGCSVLFTGHSLGAAMATLGAAELAMGATPVHLYTFGCPRVGDPAFAAWAFGRMQGGGNSAVRMRRQKDIVPAIPPRSVGYVHLPQEVWNKHLDSAGHATNDSFFVCDGSGEDPACGDSEEHPAFPLDLLHLSAAEHTRYMGFQGGNCWCGTENCP